MHGFFNLQAFEDFCGVGGTGDSRATSKGLEDGFFNHAVFADFDLELHDVAACWRANQASAHSRVGLVHCPDVPRVVVVIQDVLVVSEGSEGCLHDKGLSSKS